MGASSTTTMKEVKSLIGLRRPTLEMLKLRFNSRRFQHVGRTIFLKNAHSFISFLCDIHKSCEVRPPANSLGGQTLTYLPRAKWDGMGQ